MQASLQLLILPNPKPGKKPGADFLHYRLPWECWGDCAGTGMIQENPEIRGKPVKDDLGFADCSHKSH